MRIIDADKLKKDLSENYVFYGFRQLLNDFYEALDSAPSIKTKQIKYYDEDEQVWKVGSVIVSDSEKPNNCEHITEDGITCAKYPACDDCLDNPLNQVKGSERLVKGSEQTDCQTCKWWSSYGYCVHRECKGYEP